MKKTILATTGIIAAGVLGASISVSEPVRKPIVLNSTSTPHTLDVVLRNKTSIEKRNIKAREIVASLATTTDTFVRDNYTIQITKKEKIEGGVQIFARVWDKQGKQIGFGKDGTVDIERFRIINPPVLVDDPNGNIVRVQTATSTQTVSSSTRKTIPTPATYRHLREDPQEAILQSIEHTISVKHQKFDDSNIESGKVGNTTSTFYPDADPESTTVDGRLRDELNSTWSEARDSTTAINGADDNITAAYGPYTEITTTPDYRLVRYMALFDTSSIGSDTIDSATLSLYRYGGSDDINDAYSYVSIVKSNPASDTDLVANDFDDFYNADDTTPLDGNKDFLEMHDSGARIDLTGLAAGYMDWSFNSTGIGDINKSGVSKFGAAVGHDVEDIDPGSDVYTLSGVQLRHADYTGTASDPKLVIEHSAAAEPTYPPIIWFD